MSAATVGAWAAAKKMRKDMAELENLKKTMTPEAKAREEKVEKAVNLFLLVVGLVFMTLFFAFVF